MWMQHEILREFALDAKATSILVSLQASLLEADIAATRNTEWFGDNTAALKELKTRWRDQWMEKVTAGFHALPTKAKPAIWKPHS
jgi:hypothetical protein